MRIKTYFSMLLALAAGVLFFVPQTVKAQTSANIAISCNSLLEGTLCSAANFPVNTVSIRWLATLTGYGTVGVPDCDNITVCFPIPCSGKQSTTMIVAALDGSGGVVGAGSVLATCRGDHNDQNPPKVDPAQGTLCPALRSYGITC